LWQRRLYSTITLFDEVNIVDYLAITAIWVFVPEIYYGIRDNKEVFYKNRAKVVYIRHLG